MQIRNTFLIIFPKYLIIKYLSYRQCLRACGRITALNMVLEQQWWRVELKTKFQSLPKLKWTELGIKQKWVSRNRNGTKTGTQTKPGSWNFEKQDPKPRTKPVTLDTKSRGQLPGLLNPLSNAKYNIDMCKNSFLTIEYVKCEDKSLKTCQTGACNWVKICCMHNHWQNVDKEQFSSSTSTLVSKKDYENFVFWDLFHRIPPKCPR